MEKAPIPAFSTASSFLSEISYKKKSYRAAIIRILYSTCIVEAVDTTANRKPLSLSLYKSLLVKRSSRYNRTYKRERERDDIAFIIMIVDTVGRRKKKKEKKKGENIEENPRVLFLDTWAVRGESCQG